MAIDLKEAQAQLADLVKGTYSLNDLLDLVGKVDISASGEITVLYSGEIIQALEAAFTAYRGAGIFSADTNLPYTFFLEC